MNTKTNTKIMIERRRRTTIRVARANGNAFVTSCPICATQVEMISPEHVAALLQSSVRDVYRSIEGGEIYFVEEERSSVHICLSCATRSTAERRLTD